MARRRELINVGGGSPNSEAGVGNGGGVGEDRSSMGRGGVGRHTENWYAPQHFVETHVALTDTPQPLSISAGWRPGVLAVGQSSKFRSAWIEWEPSFSAVLQPSAAPNLSDCLRTPLRTGTYRPGLWQVIMPFKNGSGSPQGATVRLRGRIWKSANIDGTVATELTAATMLSNTITPGVIADSIARMEVYLDQQVLVAQYLFFQLGVEVMAVGVSGSDVLFQTGPMPCVQLPKFTP